MKYFCIQCADDACKLDTGSKVIGDHACERGISQCPLGYIAIWNPVNLPFCRSNCKHLSITEKEQNQSKERPKAPHFCRLYKNQVKHSGNHPRLMRLDECDIMKGK